MGTRRPRLFFVKLGTGIGAASRRVGGTSGPVVGTGELEETVRRLRTRCRELPSCTYSSSSSSSSLFPARSLNAWLATSRVAHGGGGVTNLSARPYCARVIVGDGARERR